MTNEPGEFEKITSRPSRGYWMDKATRAAREGEQRQQPWMRDLARTQAQSWRNHRWRLWDEEVAGNG